MRVLASTTCHGDLAQVPNQPTNEHTSRRDARNKLRTVKAIQKHRTSCTYKKQLKAFIAKTKHRRNQTITHWEELQQQTQKENKKDKSKYKLKINTLRAKGNFGCTIRIGTLNVRGINEQAKRELIIELMVKHNIDILAMQETKVNQSSMETKQREGTNDKYLFYYSADKPKPAKTAHQPKGKGKGKGKRKGKNKTKGRGNNNQGKGNGKGKGKTKGNPETEHHGVGFVIGPRVSSKIIDCIPHNGTMIELTIESKGPNINIINTHAPQSGRTTAEKEKHWELLHEIFTQKTKTNQHM